MYGNEAENKLKIINIPRQRRPTSLVGYNMQNKIPVVFELNSY